MIDRDLLDALASATEVAAARIRQETVTREQRARDVRSSGVDALAAAFDAARKEQPDSSSEEQPDDGMSEQERAFFSALNGA